MSGEAHQGAWLEEEDALSPSPELARYVKALDDRVANYRRFFHALLVKTPDHEIFFEDLRAFREQDHITALLTTPEVDPCRLKAIYQDCTRHFLASRFAHPWCRNEYGKHKYGFLHTTKSRQRKAAEVKIREEERLHKLLVPLWIPFRRRMMPNSEEMADFLEQERLLEARRLDLKEHEEKRRRQDEALAKLANEVDNENKDMDTDEDVSGLEFRPITQTNQKSNPTYFNAEAFVAEEDDAAHVQRAGDGTHQAASLFIGLAATSFLSNNKRASKYLLKKLNQK